MRLKDFLLVGRFTKKCVLYYGPICTYMLQVLSAAEKVYGINHLQYGTIINKIKPSIRGKNIYYFQGKTKLGWIKGTATPFSSF